MILQLHGFIIFQARAFWVNNYFELRFQLKLLLYVNVNEIYIFRFIYAFVNSPLQSFSHFTSLSSYRRIYLGISFYEITFLPTFEKYKFAYTFSVTIIVYF